MKNMFVYSSDSFNVGYDQKQLVLTCAKRLDFEEFKEGLVSALLFAENYNVKRWLFDVRNIGSLSEEEETWLQSYMFPQIMVTLGTKNYIAVVLSEKCYSALLLQAGKYGLRSYNSFIIMNTFSDTETALSWLKQEKLIAVNG
ncbi:hypothetical protein [Pontibacter sp. H249]|uniref:hypothetical protein n=1 Tax=Pontibacter sp. H249 TaxID=3133420 RepID=UPI0030BB9605